MKNDCSFLNEGSACMKRRRASISMREGPLRMVFTECPVPDKLIGDPERQKKHGIQISKEDVQRALQNL